MHILIILPGTSLIRILVEIKSQQHIRTVKDLVNRKKHYQAMQTALQSGSFEKEICAEEFENLGVDLILKENSAHWDIARKR